MGGENREGEKESERERCMHLVTTFMFDISRDDSTGEHKLTMRVFMGLNFIQNHVCNFLNDFVVFHDVSYVLS